jgi:hypothetical protein
MHVNCKSRREQRTRAGGLALNENPSQGQRGERRKRRRKRRGGGQEGGEKEEEEERKKERYRMRERGKKEKHSFNFQSFTQVCKHFFSMLLRLLWQESRFHLALQQGCQEIAMRK